MRGSGWEPRLQGRDGLWPGGNTPPAPWMGDTLLPGHEADRGQGAGQELGWGGGCGCQ